MSADQERLLEAELSDQVIGAFFDVYNALGTGFLESVYEAALLIELRGRGLDVEQQRPLQVRYRNAIIGEFRVDLLAEGRLILEIKAVSQLAPSHEAQLVNYLKASGVPLGLLLNFGPKPQFKRKIVSTGRIDPRTSA